jgi:septal ring factor EnvC (AmiA/AmiB activator)
MNKINLAIRDCEGQIKILQNQRMTIMAQLDVLKEQLDNLERIRDNKHIPHDDQHKPVTLTPVNQGGDK